MGVLVICILYSEVFLNPTEVFLCFFLSCKANARVKLANTGHGPHSSTLVVICVVRLLFVLFYLLLVCKCVLPPGDNPLTVNKYIISYILSYHISSRLCTFFCGLSVPLTLPNCHLYTFACVSFGVSVEGCLLYDAVFV